MPTTNLDIEERVIEACEWLSAPKKPCFAKATRKYSVSKYQVRQRFQGITDNSTNIRGYNKRLNHNED